MSKIFLSFLGTTDYIPCTYYFDDGKEVKNVRFVQEATVKYSCSNWTDKDRILIFTTEEAYKKNWIDDGHLENGKPKTCTGLKNCLEKVATKVPIQPISIPEGKTIDEIWEIFEILLENLDNKDQVVFDITHALRSIPMLATVVLNYAKVSKGISIQGIYYGAFEVLGSPHSVKELPLEKRRVPVFNLTAFDQLLDWTLAIDRFIGSGDSSFACDLAQKGINPILIQSKGTDKAACAINNLAKNLKVFSKALSACRGLKISESAARLKKAIAECKGQKMYKPMKPLLDRLQEQLSGFENDIVADGIRAARWCFEHNLIQQGYTILQETLITDLVKRMDLDYLHIRNRELVNKALHIHTRKKHGNQEDNIPNNNETTKIRFFLNLFEKDSRLKDALSRLVNNRNDFNHAGFRKDARSADKLVRDLGQLIGDIETIMANRKAYL